VGSVVGDIRTNWAVNALVARGRSARLQVVNVDFTVVVAVEGVVSLALVVGNASSANTSSACAVVVGASRSEVTVSGMVRVTSLVGQARNSTCSTSTADVLGNTLKLIVTLLATVEGTALSLELFHGHGGESCGCVVGGLVVVDFVDRNSGVYNIGLDGLLLDYRLDSLVDVVVHMLATNNRGDALAVCGCLSAACVLELGLVSNQCALGAFMVAVVELAVLNSADLGLVCLWEYLTVLNWLDSAVVVILVNLLVNGGVDLLMPVRLNSLLCDGWGYCLVDSSVVMA